MSSNRFSDQAVEIAQRFMKGGRFTEAVKALACVSSSEDSGDPLQQSLLADALQRTGQNGDAERIASRQLRRASSESTTIGRCHFVLGNVFRERGNVSKAIGHFQSASAVGSDDPELACWVQLRLMTTIGEFAGSQSAMARLPDVKRSLSRLGDARPFVALHLWISEIDALRGCLDSAQRHLRIAESLLAKVDDVWLHGYFAINSSVVSYYSAEISEARRWAEAALEWTRLSGHAAGRRAAFANFGHIEFSLGRLDQAEECFRRALDISDPGSLSQFAILDSIAQVKLHLGHLDDCQGILDQLDGLSLQEGINTSGYAPWALQTKIQLMLRQGRVAEADNLCINFEPILKSLTQPRVKAILGLLSVEAAIANEHFNAAAFRLHGVLSTSGELPPDLLGETERVIAKALSVSGAGHVARRNLERAIQTFEVIGHAIGKNQATSDASTIEASGRLELNSESVRSALDSVRALLETRRRPELFANEALKLLKDLDCVSNVRMTSKPASVKPTQLHNRSSKADAHDGSVVVHLGSAHENEFELDFCLKEDCASILAGLTFRRLVQTILASVSNNRDFVESEIVWSADECLSNQEVVFAADSMLQVLKTISKIAATNLGVLITGETGTGKEVIAKTIHERSERASRPFIALNCAAVPRDLLESQLFGYRRGAFSGAIDNFPGVIRATNGGTLLLDEIAEIPLEMQPKLLRFLESGEVHALGESRPSKVDVRLLFATNANLDDLVKQRRFREDLFFRINLIHIKVPPLRERREDIPLLIGLFAQRFSREFSKDVPKFAPETIEQLILNPWPGNVRQLCNEIRRVIAIVEDQNLITPDLLSQIDPEITKLRSDSSITPTLSIQLDQKLSQALDLVERTMLGHALSKTQGRVSAAAKMLGLSRKGLYLKRQRLGLSLPNSTDSALT